VQQLKRTSKPLSVRFCRTDTMLKVVNAHVLYLRRAHGLSTYSGKPIGCCDIAH
jgi:hypothetical protein